MSEKFLSATCVAAIKRHYQEAVPKEARLTDAELETALAVAEVRQLYPPPLGNHLYFIKRAQREKGADGTWGNGPSVMVIQSGIDAFRLIADRSGKYAGSSTTHEYDGQGLLTRSITEVLKLLPNGQIGKFTGDAWFEEYAQYTGYGNKRKLSKMWDEKPHVMCGKCSEAIALRKAFPELSGLYAAEEMGAETPATEEAPAAPAPRPTTTSRLPADAPATATTGTSSADRARSETAPTNGGGNASDVAGRSAQSVTTERTASTEATTGSEESSGEPLADPEKKKRLAAALALACSTFGLKRASMVKLVREWSPCETGIEPVISDEGGLHHAMEEEEYKEVVAGFKKWEAEMRRKKGDSARAEAEKEAEKWEEAQAEGVGAETPAGEGVEPENDEPF